MPYLENQSLKTAENFDSRGCIYWEESASLERGPLALLLQGLKREDG